MSDRSSDRLQEHVGDPPVERVVSSKLAGGRHASSTRRRAATYLTSDRLAVLAASLRPLDWVVLESVKLLGFVTSTQLQRLHFGDDDTSGRGARRAFRRLSDEGVLDAVHRRTGGARAGSSGVVYRLGLSGLRLLGEPRKKLDDVGHHHLDHVLAVSQFYVDLKTSERGGACELLNWSPEPSCWRRFIGHHGEPEVLKPDAYCVLRVGRTRRLWFIEVDRGTVSTTSLRQKLKRYSDYYRTGDEQVASGAFPRVVWSTTTARRLAHLGELIETENRRLGLELHRLLGQEWQPPPSAADHEQGTHNEGGES